MLRRLLFPAFLVVLAAGCPKAADTWKDAKPGQLKVLASFPPLYSWTVNVGGDDAHVVCLLTGVGPHDYHANATDALRVRNADFFVINSLELDNKIAGDLIKSAGNKSIKLIETGEMLPDEKLIHLDEDGHDHKHHHKDGHKHDHKHGDHDPHVWLNPEFAADIVVKLGAKFGEAKPEKKKEFADRAAAYAKELKGLHEYAVEQFKGKKNRRIITMHESLGYFAQAYGLEVVGSIQNTPGIEADAAQMTKLAQKCKEKTVSVIAIEPQYPKNSADTLKNYLQKQGTPVEIVEFDTLETATADALKPDFYVTRMKQNIDRLVKALP
jgi:zinc transport system substrate-binding protein